MRRNPGRAPGKSFASRRVKKAMPRGWAHFSRDIGHLDRAVNDLRRRAPDLSAATPMPAGQCAALLALTAGVAAGFVVLDDDGLTALTLFLAIPFLLIALIRIVAIWQLFNPQSKSPASGSRDVIADGRLPTYSVLVPLLRETAVVPGLVRAMQDFDYPINRLEIVFIIEAADDVTYLALLLAGLAPNMRIVVVPPGEPKTKPRALNYALQEARGALVAIYDAEDHPDPDQLRIAAEAFIDGGPKLACVQARLAINNASESFWTRQFAQEYTALFGGFLPALDRLGLPLPLGGTSNHFRRDVLLRSGGWDPFNVTEDADLGVRLSRLGYEVSVIDSVTMEEAPVRWRVWIGQRTRWLKGWVQTYLVHMRRPPRLWRDLGARRFFGFQIVIGGMIASMLVHPWFYVSVGWHLWWAQQIAPANRLLLALCVFNLAAGYGAAAVLAAVAALKTNSAMKLGSLLWIPVYWLAISYASYRAIVDLIFRPFYWEKTAHDGRRLQPGAHSQRPR